MTGIINVDFPVKTFFNSVFEAIEPDCSKRCDYQMWEGAKKELSTWSQILFY